MKQIRKFFIFCWVFYCAEMICSSPISVKYPRFSFKVRSIEHVVLGYPNLRLRCKAEGDPKPKIHWYRHRIDGDPEPLVPNSRFKIEQTYLRITRIEPWDEGSYSCIVWNQSGSIYRNFTIIIDDVEATWDEFYKRGLFSKEELANRKAKRVLLMNSLLDKPSPVPVARNEPYRVNFTNATAISSLSGFTFSDDSNYTNFINDQHSVANMEIIAIVIAVLFTAMVFSVSLILFLRYCKHKLRFNCKIFCTKSSMLHRRRALPTNRRYSTSTPLGRPKVTLNIDNKNLNLNFRTDSVFDFTYLESISSNPKWEIERNNLILSDSSLGEGEFGRVLHGQLKTPHGYTEYQQVAVKMLKIGEATNREFVALISELKMLKTIGRHPNIVNLIGHCTKNGPIYVVYEHCAFGNLRDFLRQRRPTENCDPKDRLTVYDLVRFAFQVARGMKFLASKKCIHRDLAARNIFVTEDKILKIGDFGLARDVESSQYYRRKSDNFLPVRWLAPESLHSKIFTIESDIWSCGVVFWEIMTLGGKPYSSIPVDFLYSYLSDGNRLVKPHECPEEVYCVMWNCWKFDPNQRWSFARIENYLDELIMASSSKNYVTVVQNLEDVNESFSSVEIDAVDDDDDENEDSSISFLFL